MSNDEKQAPTPNELLRTQMQEFGKELAAIRERISRIEEHQYQFAQEAESNRSLLDRVMAAIKRLMD